MHSDDELMQEVAEGDLSAFDELMRRYQQSVWSVAYRLTGDSAEAEDLAQDTFLRILTAAPRYRAAGSFRGYLFRIVSRLHLDLARKKKPVLTAEVPDCGDPSPSPLERLEVGQETGRVRRALADLPRHQRVAIVLRYYEDMRYAEIAETMGITEKAVERLLDRGRKALRRRLAGGSGQRKPGSDPR